MTSSSCDDVIDEVPVSRGFTELFRILFTVGNRSIHTNLPQWAKSKVKKNNAAKEKGEKGKLFARAVRVWRVNMSDRKIARRSPVITGLILPSFRRHLE